MLICVPVALFLIPSCRKKRIVFFRQLWGLFRRRRFNLKMPKKAAPENPAPLKLKNQKVFSLRDLLE
jgi:hypothetical protein